MKDKVIKILVTIVVVIFISTLALVVQKKFVKAPIKADYSNLVHSSLVKNALDTWDSDYKAVKFRPKEINGNKYGSASYIRLEWDAPETTYNHFLITITEPRSEWKRVESGEHERFSLDISDLQPDTIYVFMIQACTDPECSTWFAPNSEISQRTDKLIWHIDETPQNLDTEIHKTINDFDFSKSIVFTHDKTQLKQSEFDIKEIINTLSDDYKKFAKIEYTNSSGDTQNATATLLNP